MIGMLLLGISAADWNETVSLGYDFGVCDGEGG